LAIASLAVAASLLGPTARAAVAAAQVPEGHHVVFSLADNRLAAHGLRQGGLAVEMGHPSVVKYTRFARPTMPWRLGVPIEGRKTALPLIAVVSLELPLTPAQAAADSTLYVRVKSATAQTLRLKMNKTPLEIARLQAGWQVMKVAVPQAALKAGENILEIAFGQMGTFPAAPKALKAGGAFEWLQLRAATAPAPADDETVQIAQPGRLSMPRGGGVAFYLAPTPKLKLHAGKLTGQGSCVLHAQILSEEGTRSASFVLAGPAGEGKGMLDLEPYVKADDTVRLELWADAPTEKDRCDEAQLEGAALVAAGPAPAARPAGATAPKNVLIWLVDSLRADRLKLYNPRSRVETPNLDKLAARGVVFQQHYVQGIESRSSHASLWSGLYPIQHRVITESAKLNTLLPTLAKNVRPSGRYCALRSANGFVNKGGGFGEGWHFMRNHIRDAEGGGVKAADFARHAVTFLEKTAKPFFLYLGTVDCHVSWRSHEPWISKYDAENDKNGPAYKGTLKHGFSGQQLEDFLAHKLALNDRDRLRAKALYDSDVSYNDQNFGIVLSKLEEAGRLDDTMIIITGDHGDEFWEHGTIGHGGSLKEAVVGVPLIISYPPLFPKGKVVKEGAEVIDVFPTILDAIDQPVPETIQGSSLVPLAQGVGEGYPRPSIGSQYEFAHAMRLGKWKMWVGGGPTPRLFDITSEEKEHKDLAGEKPFQRRLLTDAFGTFLTYQKRWHKARWGVASNQTAQLAADLEADPATASR
jgi:arylsulfatase A-like enzyme